MFSLFKLGYNTLKSTDCIIWVPDSIYTEISHKIQ